MPYTIVDSWVWVEKATRTQYRDRVSKNRLDYHISGVLNAYENIKW